MPSLDALSSTRLARLTVWLVLMLLLACLPLLVACGPGPVPCGSHRFSS